MKLTTEEKRMLSGREGHAVQQSMHILVSLGEIFGARRLIPVSSVQIAGVSYHNLGEAGLSYLSDLATDGKVRVLTTLNPAGMDLENWKALGIDRDFAEKQVRVIEAFRAMGVIPTCTCTPYLIGNVPRFGEHIAWSESSAVCYANSVLGARTNREGGPSALASALTGRTPEFGLHLDRNRKAAVLVEVSGKVENITDFGALGYAIGVKIGNRIPLIRGIKEAGIEELKSFCASIATYGGTAMFHMEGITPGRTPVPRVRVKVTEYELGAARRELTDGEEVDLVAIGCPHLSLKELSRLAALLEGKKVKKETWVCVARPLKRIAEQAGYVKAIEDAGAKFACDTCMAVAPLKGRFRCMATDSAKGCFYGRGKNAFKTRFMDMEELVKEATS